MARRRRPSSPTAWLAGLIGTVAIALTGYYGRIAIIENMAERQIAHAQRAQQQIKEQQLARQQHAAQSDAAIRQLKRDQMAQATEDMRLNAERERRRNAAWNQFYQEPRGCDNWQSDQHMVECLSLKSHAKTEFERKWSAGDFDQPQS
jgi:hypothetical protein